MRGGVSEDGGNDEHRWRPSARMSGCAAAFTLPLPPNHHLLQVDTVLHAFIFGVCNVGWPPDDVYFDDIWNALYGVLSVSAGGALFVTGAVADTTMPIAELHERTRAAAVAVHALTVLLQRAWYGMRSGAIGWGTAAASFACASRIAVDGARAVPIQLATMWQCIDDECINLGVMSDGDDESTCNGTSLMVNIDRCMMTPARSYASAATYAYNQLTCRRHVASVATGGSAEKLSADIEQRGIGELFI
jgi:hypothetical protein